MNGLERCNDCGRLALSSETVTLPADEYRKLLQDAAAGRAKKAISSYRAVSRSGIGLNPELADFILDVAPTMSIAKIHAACVERFGEKAPSASSIFRFIDKMRDGARP